MFKFPILLCIFLFFPYQLFALDNKILFKVNNEIITTLDIYNESKYLNIINEEFKDFENQKIYEIAKNSIIKEMIRENELKKFFKKIKLKDEFLNEFILNYFKKFNIETINDLEQILKRNGLKLEDIEKKISIQILWNELIFKKFSKNVKIDREKIKKQVLVKKTQEEFLISEIVFNVDSKLGLDKKFNKIKNELKNNSFSKVAIIHSISETSLTGGKIGWVKESSLSKKIKDELIKLKIGEITNPIQIPGAFIILKIEDKRETQLEMDINKEIDRIIKIKTNEQLDQFSNIYFNKIKKDTKINAL